MHIGDLVETGRLIEILDASGVMAVHPDRTFPQLMENLNVHGWTIHHVAYKPRLRFWERGEPGFLFVLQDPDSGVTENFEVPYGPSVRDFVL